MRHWGLTLSGSGGQNAMVIVLGGKNAIGYRKSIISRLWDDLNQLHVRYPVLYILNRVYSEHYYKICKPPQIVNKIHLHTAW